MGEVFVDTSYCLALLSRDDEFHERAREYLTTPPGIFVTTEWVLLELGNHLSHPQNRKAFLTFVADLRMMLGAVVITSDESLFAAGCDLYAARLDKGWSLTDCISFIVMRDRGIQSALTADQHFAQAGFDVLLKK